MYAAPFACVLIVCYVAVPRRPAPSLLRFYSTLHQLPHRSEKESHYWLQRQAGLILFILWELFLFFVCFLFFSSAKLLFLSIFRDAKSWSVFVLFLFFLFKFSDKSKHYSVNTCLVKGVRSPELPDLQSHAVKGECLSVFLIDALQHLSSNLRSLSSVCLLTPNLSFTLRF